MKRSSGRAMRGPFSLALALLVASCGGKDGYNGLGELALSGTVTFDAVPARISPSSGLPTLDYEATVARPVRGAVVELRQGNTVLVSTATDDQGRYSFAYSSTKRGALDVVVLARTTTPPIQVEDNTDGDSIWALAHRVGGPTETIDLHATHGWSGSKYDARRRQAAPFALLDSLTTAARSFLAVRPVSFPPLRVNWSPKNVPQSGDKAAGFISTSHYDPAAGEIFVLGKDGVDTDEFDAQVVIHEWTHYFEAQLSRSDSPGGPHMAGDILDPRIAFGEGLGNALAALALGDPLYIDTSWDPNAKEWSGFFIDSENVEDTGDYVGVFSESTVQHLVYDLFDTNGNEPFDTFNLGMGPLFDALTGPQKTTNALTTIGSFIAALKVQPGVDSAQLDALLQLYGIGPIEDEWGTGDADLAGMYTYADTIPASTSIALGGGNAYNTYEQNQYFVFLGTGGRVRITAASAEDVGLKLFRAGMVVGEADEFTAGTETLEANTTLDAVYVFVLTGFAENPGDYQVDLSISGI